LEKPTIMQIQPNGGEWLKNAAIISDAQNASSTETSASKARLDRPSDRKYPAKANHKLVKAKVRKKLQQPNRNAQPQSAITMLPQD